MGRCDGATCGGGLTVFRCPECREDFETLQGATMHYYNSNKGHSKLSTINEIKAVIRGDTGDDSDDSGEHGSDDLDGERRTAPFGEPESGPGTEPGPGREPEPEPTDSGIMELNPGQKVWVMQNGNVGRLEAEAGDYIDVTRGVLVESDGSSEWVITTEPEGFNE